MRFLVALLVGATFPLFAFLLAIYFLCLYRHRLIASSHPDPDHAALRHAQV